MYLAKTQHKRTLKFNRTALAKLTMFMIVITVPVICATSLGYTAPKEYRAAPEYLIKAAYLHKFLFFVKWPNVKQSSIIQSHKTITIGIVGQNSFVRYFRKIEGQVIKSINKKVAVKYFGPYSEGIDLKQCQLLFISASEKNNTKMILNSVNGAAILTVADTEGFLKLGGMINLVNVRGRIRWEINLTPAKQAGLKVSSTLLQSAVDVVRIPKFKDKR